MITKTQRPSRFVEVVGQSMPVKVLMAIAREPQNAPSTIILEGSWGSGKTTCARLFAKALNCEQHSGEVCSSCKVCRQDIEMSPFYSEYNSAVMGNVDAIRELRDTFAYTVSGGWKVVVIDEAHLVSRQGQSAFLKIVEEAPKNVKFLFCSTDVDKILNTIQSRSLILHFDTIPPAMVVENLKGIAQKLSVEVDDETLNLIALRSKGHMRNAHMLLDHYILIGKEDFSVLAKSAKREFLRYFGSIGLRNKENVSQCVDALMRFPLADLKEDFQALLLDFVKISSGFEQGEETTRKVVSLFGANVLKVVRLCMEDWVLRSFENDVKFQTTMLALFQMIAQTGTPGRCA